MPIQRFDIRPPHLRANVVIDGVGLISVVDGPLCLSKDVAELEAELAAAHATIGRYVRDRLLREPPLSQGEREHRALVLQDRLRMEENARNEPVVRTAGQE